MPTPVNRTAPVMTGGTSDYIPGDTSTIVYPPGSYPFPTKYGVPPESMPMVRAAASVSPPPPRPLPTFQQFMAMRGMAPDGSGGPVYRDMYNQSR